VICNKNSKSNLSSIVRDRICRLNTIQLAAKQYLHYRLTHVVRFFLHSSRGGFKSTTESKTFECCTRARKLATCCFCPHITLCACSGHQRLIEFVRVRKAPVANERSFFVKWILPFQEAFYMQRVSRPKLIQKSHVSGTYEIHRIRLSV
jgi:hypothetical protein